MKVAPHSVSGRVVKTVTDVSYSAPAVYSAPSLDSRFGASGVVSGCSILNCTSAPSERPIQFVCSVCTVWGQSICEKSSSSSAYLVVLKNHCSSSFLITGVPQRSQTRFSPTTCSRARVVLSLGHQSTADLLRYASPIWNSLMKNHCVHL